MTKHTSYRGVQIDIEALRNENANTVAVGNMKVNARGDVLGPGGTIAKTVDQVAKENQRIRTPIQAASLKSDVTEQVADAQSTRQPINKKKDTVKKPEKELDNRDIIQDDGGDE